MQQGQHGLLRCVRHVGGIVRRLRRRARLRCLLLLSLLRRPCWGLSKAQWVEAGGPTAWQRLWQRQQEGNRRRLVLVAANWLLLLLLLRCYRRIHALGLLEERSQDRLPHLPQGQVASC